MFFCNPVVSQSVSFSLPRPPALGNAPPFGMVKAFINTVLTTKSLSSSPLLAST